MGSGFYVRIIESPSPDELLYGQTEGKALCSFLDISKIPYTYHLAIDRRMFGKALMDQIYETTLKFEAVPILHLSMHGSEKGIILTNQRDPKEIITWRELAKLIKPIKDLFGRLGICLSSCMGAYGQKMAEVIMPEELPFDWIVGTSDTAYLQDLALAFAIFYRGFQRDALNQSGLDFIKAIQIATNITGFHIEFGEFTQERYKKEIITKLLKTLKKPDSSTGIYGGLKKKLS